MKTLLARLLLVVSIALLPALALQVYAESQARNARQQLMTEEALRLLGLVGAEQQRIAEGAEQALDVLIGASAVQDGQAEACPRLLANLLAQAPRYDFAGVIGLDGHFICASAPFDPGINVSDRAYFRDALRTGGFVIGAYGVGRVSGAPSVQMAKPFRRRDGTVGGVVALGLGLGWLGQQLERLPLPPGATASVTDRNGIVLARAPDGARYVGQPILAENLFSLHGNAVGVVPMRMVDGRTRLVAYAPPDAGVQGVRIAVGLDPDITFAVLVRANRTGALLIAAGAVLALAVTALAGRRLIRRPLDRLLAVADRWRAGDLAARTRLRADASEFGRLAAAFDRMAAALETREAALRSALESTTDAVVVLDRGWRITYLNARAGGLIAQGRDLLGRVVWEALPGAAGSAFGEACRAAVVRRRPTQVDYYVAPLQTHFEVNVCPAEDGITLFFRDITHERRMQRHFRAVFEQAAVGMAVAGLNRVPLLVNDRLCTITGYSREELLARSFIAITHPDDRAADQAQTAALVAGEISTFTVEKRYLRKDGEVLWINLTVSLLRDPEGRPECHIGVLEDITARKRAEEDLRQATALLRAIGECSPDPVYAKDTASRFIFANPATLAVVGMRAEELIGRTGGERHPDSAVFAAFIANDRRVLQTGRAEIIDEVFGEGEGSRIFRSAKAPLRLPDGPVIGVVGVSCDITQAKQTEARLRQLTLDLERRVGEEVAARQRQDMLMAELDHRVKNMLATIQALLAQSRSGAETLDEFLEGFEGRLRAMGRSHSLLTKTRWEGAGLHALIAEEVAPYVGAAGPPVTIEAGVAVLLRPKAALALSLAVHELATNAAKYGALSVPGGRVRVDWRTGQRDGQGGEEQPGGGQVLVLRWRESGGPPARPPARRGFGLTLIEHSLAYELGGTVQLGFPAEGLTCTMVVPWDQLAGSGEVPPPPAPAVAAAGEAPGTLGGLRILVVEDNALLAASVVRHLHLAGAVVVGPVARLEAAAEMAATAAIELALLDVDLDGTPVWPAADLLVRRGIPFVFATGFQASLVLPERFAQVPVVNKPFTARELRGVLAGLVRGAAAG